MTMIENKCFNCSKTVSCKVTTIENQKGYRWHMGASRGCQGELGVSEVYWGLTWSVGTQGQNGYRWHKGALGSPRGCWGLLGASGGVRGVLGLAGSVSTQGPEGVLVT